MTTKFKNQKQLFNRIRNNRERRCVISGKYIYEPGSFCFAHILGKGMHPSYKLKENNIALVYGINEHNEVDVLTAGYAHVIQGMIDDGKTANEIIHFLKQEKGLD